MYTYLDTLNDVRKCVKPYESICVATSRMMEGCCDDYWKR